jgi:hypothetical protein
LLDLFNHLGRGFRLRGAPGELLPGFIDVAHHWLLYDLNFNLVD